MCFFFLYIKVRKMSQLMGDGQQNLFNTVFGAVLALEIDMLHNMNLDIGNMMNMFSMINIQMEKGIEQEQSVNNNSRCYGAPLDAITQDVAHHLIYLGLYTLVWH
ncbi:hypothetical protein ACJX0J_027168, partial [Zea mays]